MGRSKINIKAFLEQNRIAGPREVWHVFVMGFQATPLINTISLILEFGDKLIAPAQVWISKLIIDTIVALASSSESMSDGRQRVISLLLIEFALVALSKVINSVSRVLDDNRSFTYGLIMQKRIMHKALSLDIAYFDNSEFIKRYSYLAGSFKDVPFRTYRWVTDNALEIWGSLVFIPLFLTLDPRILLLAIVSPFVSYFFTLWFGPKFRKRRTEEWAMAGKASYFANLASSYENLKEVRVFGLSEWLFCQYRERMNTLYVFMKRSHVMRFIDDSIDFLLNQVSYYVAYAVSIFETIAGHMSLGSLTMVIQSFEQLRRKVGTLFRIIDPDLFKDISEFSVFMKLQPGITDSSGSATISPFDFTSLEVSQASFTYDECELPATDRISLTIKRGEHIALVGDNGSGKSTLIKLLLRLYDPDSGSVMVNGRDMREYQTAHLHGLFSAIFQDFVRYQATVRENIEISHVESGKNAEEAAILAGAHEFITLLPDGYDTVINKRGPGCEDAVELSEGQWQKIALARAFYRDAPILVLDEPTASVDAKTEYKLYKYFKDHAEDKTLILISHHFSSVRFADHIYVLDKGRIVEHGAHHELMDQKGKYFEMFQMQMEGLQDVYKES